MSNVRPEDAPEPKGFESIADKIGKTELTGLLWWAIKGWQRLAARGTFEPPPIMLEASRALKDDNNPVDAWRRECLDLRPDSKVLRADLLASMNGWCAQEYGADSKPWAGRGFFPRLTKMIPGYSKEKSETADVDGNRMLIGVELSQAGLLAWRVWKDSRFGETTHTSPGEELINKDHAPGRMIAIPPENRRPRF
jgi:phage/plasmid-associated DNA primase